MSLPYVRVEVGFLSPYVGNMFVIGDPDRGRIGVYGIGDPDVWVDISQYVRSWSIRRGATQGNTPTRRYDAGTATIVLNDADRRFDPDNLAGPYVSAGLTQVTPMRRVRVTAEWNGVGYPLFYGFSDDWTPDYVADVWTYTTLTATDATKVFSAVNRTAVAPAGTSDLSGTRIGRILNAYGWPSTDRDIDAGDTTLQATTLDGNMLAEMQLTQDTELGELFVDPLGRVAFQGRASILSRSESITSQATFGDGGYDATGELPYADVKLSSLDDSLTNNVTIGRTGGTPQTATDAASVAEYLSKSYEKTDLLMESDPVALSYAQGLLYQYKDPVRQPARLEFRRPRHGIENAVWPEVLGREFGDRITVIRRPAGGGTPIERDCFVRGFEHAGDSDQWTSAFVLQAADKYSYFVIGHPNLGRIGAYPIAF